MARRAFAASFVLGSIALLGQGLTQGCTQDFSAFDGSGGSDPAGTGSQSSSGTGTPTSSSGGSPTTTTGAGGEGGATTGGGSEQGGGGAGGCDGPADCDDDNPCTTDACSDGVCDNVAVTDGPVGGTDDPEDCRNHECQAGAEIDEADDTEDPADANPPCELTNCAGGAPTADFAVEGTVCGDDPQVCDGAGTCLGCDPEGDPTQCGAATACSAPSCEDPGECDPGFFDEGTPVTDPTNGDCQASECTGDSVVPESVDDDTDVPADLPCATAACDAGDPDFTTLLEGMACIGQAGVCDGAGNNAANCRTCRDTAGGNGVDAGCSAGTPLCDEFAGGGAGVCRTCNDSAGGAGTDQGCSDTDQVCDPTGLGTCVECYTDGDGDTINCPGADVCEPVGDGDCRTCYDEGDGVNDAGCGDAAPACDEGTDTCEECQGPADCANNPEGLLCNQSGNDECGCTGGADAPSCNGSSRGTRCIANTACGCTGGNGSADCDHAGSAGPNCNGSGVCVP